MQTDSLQRNIIITGASGHLGKAACKVFLEKGYHVIATVHETSSLDNIPKHEYLEVKVVNLSDEAETLGFISWALEQYKKIDAALMLAGGFAVGGISDTGMNDINKQIKLNFETAFHIARSLLGPMLEQNEGKLVFIGARPALQAADGKNLLAYGLSKSLLFKLAEYINAESKGKNVTATVIVPSTLDTPPNRESMPQAEASNWVKPAALAEILEWVCSESASTLRETVLKVYNNA